jgi:type I restriction enzyme S subunit
MWDVRRLGDVCEIVNGGTPKTGVREYWGGERLWITPAEMGNRSSPYADHTQRMITDLGLQNSSARPLPPYSVILSSRAPIGHLVINTKPMATNQGCKGLVPSSLIDHKYLFHYLGSIVSMLNDLGTGATFKELSSGNLKAVEIPLPPVTEQKRIVAILDEAFDAIATARANTEQNLRNARELFESHLNAVFNQRGEALLAWAETTLGAEVDLLAGFAFKSAQYTTAEGDVQLLRGDNIIQGSLRWEDVKKWPKSDAAEYRRYELRDGDVVLAMDRPWVQAGLKRAMVSESDLPCLLVQRTARLRGRRTMHQRFLLHLIGSSEFASHILGIQTGIGVPHVSGQQIKDFAFLRPSLEEQHRIAGNLDCIRAEIERLSSICERKLSALEMLKQSLLHHAFAGAL